MNKQGSKSEQFLRFVVLAFAGMMLWNYFGHNQTNTPAKPPRPAIAFDKIWQGIDPASGPALTKDQATAEVKRLQALVKADPKDSLADSARLREALIDQYILDDLNVGKKKSGFLGLSGMVEMHPLYDEIINSGKGDIVEAQAVYQEGDLLWRESSQGGKAPSGYAVSTLDSLMHKGRGSSEFLGYKIYIPAAADPKEVPVHGLPPGGFRLVSVGALKGTLSHPNLQGIPDRVNAVYSTSPYYKAFDFVVNLLGAKPEFSYGLAILVFALGTRLILQPLNKKQYESMKGMALIAPEMKKIQAKYKGRSEQNSQVDMVREIQALQKRHGVSPYMSCGLAAVQMPVFFLFVYPLIQYYEPKMELAAASFLWIGNLGQRDIALLVMYGLSMFFSVRLSSTPPADDAQKQQQLIMSFAMPLVLPFFLMNYPAAFTMYWMAFNVASTAFQWRMIKAADPGKSMIKTLLGTEELVQPALAEGVPLRPTKAKSGQTIEVVPLSSTSNSGSGSNGRSANNKSGEVLATGPRKKKKK